MNERTVLLLRPPRGKVISPPPAGAQPFLTPHSSSLAQEEEGWDYLYLAPINIVGASSAATAATALGAFGLLLLPTTGCFVELFSNLFIIDDLEKESTSPSPSRSSLPGGVPALSRTVVPNLSRRACVGSCGDHVRRRDGRRHAPSRTWALSTSLSHTHARETTVPIAPLRFSCVCGAPRATACRERTI